MKTIFIAGGSGLIGSHLAQRLKNKYRVFVLSRNPLPDSDGVSFLQWKPEDAQIAEPPSSPDIIINLAGAGIADSRWTDARKELLIRSRVAPALGLATWLNEHKICPELYIGASAIGYYGDRGNEILDESSAGGEGFLNASVSAWESAHTSVGAHRSALLRIGIVLSTRGGALPKMMLTVPWLRLLSYFGSGKQMQSWIHIDDLCSIVECCIEDKNYHGTINAVSPAALSNRHMIGEIKKALPFFTWVAPVPAFILKWILGEMSHVVLDSTRVLPAFLMQKGFSFAFPSLRQAIEDLRSRKV